MFRYFSLVWDVADIRQEETVALLRQHVQARLEGGHCAIDQNGLVVFYWNPRPGSTGLCALEADRGVVLGTLFSSQAEGLPAFRTRSLDAADSTAIIQTEGRRLVERYWGRYVAFLIDPSVAKIWVIRDPAGGMPCLTTVFRDVSLYFSHISDYDALGLVSLSVNWQHILWRLIAPQAEGRETGIAEVSCVLRGECVERSRGFNVRNLYWDPFTFAQRDVIEELDEAAKLVRETVRACVHSWASCYPSIVLRLSGGLDSSIVLMCLRDAPTAPRVVCLNSFSAGGDEDERRYARSAAARAGVEIVERPRSPEVPLENMLNAPKWFHPAVSIPMLECRSPDALLAKLHHAQTLFDGNGGDQLFFRHPAEAAPADYARQYGLRSGFLVTCLDAAYRENLSFWRVAGRALRDGLSARSWKPFEQWRISEFLSRPALETLDLRGERLHPWFARPSALGPGKLWHIFYASTPIPFHYPFQEANEPEMVSPLFSQPVQELMLRITTPVLIRGGQDRAVARRAFAQDLPAMVLQRTGKGGVDTHVKNVLLRNIQFVREMLLDGHLVKQGLLDRERLTKAVALELPDSGASPMRLWNCLISECWARNWLEAGGPRGPSSVSSEV